VDRFSEGDDRHASLDIVTLVWIDDVDELVGFSASEDMNDDANSNSLEKQASKPLIWTNDQVFR